MAEPTAAFWKVTVLGKAVTGAARGKPQVAVEDQPVFPVPRESAKPEPQSSTPPMPTLVALRPETLAEPEVWFWNT